MWNVFRRFLLTCAACLVVISVFAQPKSNSPYSRFGVGDLLNQSFTNLRATPGFGNAYNNNYHINLQNPASLGFLGEASFDFGLYGRNSQWETGTQQNTTWSGNMSHLALGFTLNNPVNDLLEREVQQQSWGMSFALVPYSLVGYEVQTIGELENVGTVVTDYEGEGGLNQFMWGVGYRRQQFAAGIRLGYIFGKIQNIRQVTFEDLIASYQDQFLDDYTMNGFTWRLGLQYNWFLNKESVRKAKVLTFGVTASAAPQLNTNATQFYQRFNPSYVITPQDTIVSRTDVEGNAQLPAEFGVGVLYSYASKWKIGANYDFAGWGNYENDAYPESLSNSWRGSLSVELTPDYASFNRYLKRIRYRLGVFAGTDPRSINGEQLRDYGLTVGLGLPIRLPRQRVSFINMSFELGKRGGNTSLQESYGEFTLGFTLNDNSWFFKRKFN